MKHDYTDEEIRTAWKDSLSLRAFLDALPALRQPQPVVVNEPPQHEGQPDLSGESEKQNLGAMVKAAREAAIKGLTGPAWIPHDGGPCPLKDKEVEEFEFKIRDGKVSGNVFVPSGWRWSNDDEAGDIIAYRVLKWKPGFGPEEKAQQAEPAQPTTSPVWTPAVGDVVRSTPEMALGGQMYWRDLAIQLARVWWKCHNIGASLQHGDLNKDIAFSIVCERHGGRVFHGGTPEKAWNKAEEWLLSPDRENFPAACLTPVTNP